MKRFHESITKIEKNGETVVTNYKLFNEIIRSSENAQVITIPIFGKYQIGKSSLVQMLTGDTNIDIGDGSKEETAGAMIYGPYPFNDIRKRFGMLPIKEDINIYFIDTEGIGGYRLSSNAKLNQLFLTEIFTPYLAISPIGIMMHESNIDISISQYLKDILKVAQELINHDELLTIISVVPSQRFVATKDGKKLKEKEKYINACHNLLEIIPDRLDGINVSKYIALSSYNSDKLPLEQSQEFIDRFQFAATDIINYIEEASKSRKFDSEGVIDLFRFYNNNKTKLGFPELVKRAKIEGEFSTTERMFMPNVRRLLESTKYKIERLYPTIADCSSEEDRLMKKTIDIDPILKIAYDKLNEYEFPQFVRKMCIEKFQSFISKELTEHNNNLCIKYLQELEDRQKEFLISKAVSVINSICSESIAQLKSSKEKTVDEETLKKCIGRVTSESNQIIEEISRRFNIRSQLKTDVLDIIGEKEQETKDKLEECAKKVAEDNRVKEKERKMQDKIDALNIVSAVATCIQSVGSLVSIGQSIAGHIGSRIASKVVSSTAAAATESVLESVSTATAESVLESVSTATAESVLESVSTAEIIIGASI